MHAPVLSVCLHRRQFHSKNGLEYALLGRVGIDGAKLESLVPHAIHIAP